MVALPSRTEGASAVLRQEELRVGTGELVLWAVVVLATIVDGVSTYYGLQVGMTEANPVMASAIQRFGYWGIALVKTAAIGAAVGCRLSLPNRHGRTVPAGLLLPWGFAALVNLVGIVGL